MVSQRPIVMLGTAPNFSGVGQLKTADRLDGILNESDLLDNSVMIKTAGGAVTAAVLSTNTFLGNTGGGIGVLGASDLQDLFFAGHNFTNAGEILYYDGVELTILGVGATGQFLRYNGSGLEWATSSGSGVTTLLALTDVANTYIADAYLRVDPGGNGVIFEAVAPGDTNLGNASLTLDQNRVFDVNEFDFAFTDSGASGGGGELSMGLYPGAVAATDGEVIITALYSGNGGGITVSDAGVNIDNTGTGQFLINGASGASQLVGVDGSGQLEFTTVASGADDLGNHTATESLKMATFAIENSGAMDFATAISLTSAGWSITEDTDNIVITADPAGAADEVFRYDPSTTLLTLDQYPSSRDDTGTFTPTTFMYAGPSGELYVSPITEITEGIPTTNLTDVSSTAPVAAGLVLQWDGVSEYAPVTVATALSGTSADALSNITITSSGVSGAVLRNNGSNVFVEAELTLDDLDGVDTTGAVAQDTLIFDGSDWLPGAAAGISAAGLSGLAAGHGLIYDGANFVNRDLVVNDLDTFNVAAPSDLQLIRYDNGAGEWTNVTAALNDFEPDANLSLFDTVGATARSVTRAFSYDLEPGGEAVTWSIGISAGVTDNLLFNANATPRFALTSSGDLILPSYGGARNDAGTIDITSFLYSEGSGTLYRASVDNIPAYDNGAAAATDSYPDDAIWKASATNDMGVPEGTLMTTTSAAVADPLPITITEQVANYTPDLDDRSTIVEMNSGVAVDVTVPLDSTVDFPVGTEITFLQTGTGVVSFVAEGGVTLNSVAGQLDITAQWAAATIIKRAADTWVLIGDIS